MKYNDSSKALIGNSCHAEDVNVSDNDNVRWEYKLIAVKFHA